MFVISLIVSPGDLTLIWNRFLDLADGSTIFHSIMFPQSAIEGGLQEDDTVTVAFRREMYYLPTCHSFMDLAFNRFPS